MLKWSILISDIIQVTNRAKNNHELEEKVAKVRQADVLRGYLWHIMPDLSGLSGRPLLSRVRSI